MDFSSILIGREACLRDAMRKLDDLNCKILFVADNNVLIGSLTDGDIRRFLLDGGKIEDSAEMAANHNVHTASNAAEAARLLKQADYVAIPIVNSKNEILDIYRDKHIKKKCNPINIPVVINAGGKGTRLDPFTRVLPKPLIPVGELPIIEHIMRGFIDYGCNEFHTIVNYKKQLIKSFFSESERQYDISFYDEKEPLGTGGGLSLLKGKLHETFFFTNCDILLRSNFESIYRFHKEHNNMITMVCAYKNFVVPYGVVSMGENGQILEMREKPEMSFLTNTGVYIVEPEVLEDIEDNVSIGFPDIIEKQKAKGKNVAVYPISENEWLDMGQLPELEQMRKKLYGE